MHLFCCVEGAIVSNSLIDLVDFLDGCTAAQFKGTKVSDYLQKTSFEIDDFAHFAYFREDTYGRNLIVRQKEYELLLLTWLPGQKAPIHDHAGSRCWMAMLSGALTFQHYRADDSAAPVSLGQATVQTAGANFYIDDGIGLHSIENRTSKPAMSVHIYAKPIERCRTYSETKRALEWVDLDYFTSPDLQATLT